MAELHNIAGASDAIRDIVARARPSVTEVRAGGRGIGTGIVWGPDSVLTNAHVVGGGRRPARGVQVVTHDGRALDAAVSRSQPQLDLALLSVPTATLAPAVVGDSDALRVGELVFAIGHPWGQVGVVTGGIVSGLGAKDAEPVDAYGRRRIPYIRSDVHLAPGNSGGPLLNAAGEVVGINAMIFGGDLGVAIPSRAAREWLDEGVEPAPKLGVGVQAVSLPALVASRLPEGQPGGLLVVDVDERGPATGALLVGDIVLRAAGRKVMHPDALAQALAAGRRAGQVRLDVLRGGALRSVDVSL